MIVLLGLLAACTGEQATPPPAPTPPPPVTVQPVTLWKAENIRELVPKAPTRKSKTSRPIATLPAYEQALATLGRIVDAYAGDPDNPWAIAHGILARGAAFRLADGRQAIPHLFASYAEPRVVGSLELIGFPRERGTIRIEPHTDLLLKNMGEAGLAPDATFPGPKGEVAVADLYRYTVLKTFLKAETNESSFDSPNDIPWALQALAQWAPDEELQWIASNGMAMDLDFLTSFTVAVLTQESAFLFTAMQKGQSFDRSGQPLFSYTCGGAHLLQGASYAVARGFGTPRDRQAIEAQVGLWFYRMPIELKIYDEALKRNPKFKLQLLVQRVKFLGHFLESMSRMAAMGLYTPDDTQMQLLEGAAQNLTLTVTALEQTGALDNMDKLKAENYQLYLDITGDAAHAIHGLELAMGRAEIGW